MSKSVFLVGGGKGGVGKSLFSIALIDYLEGSGEGPFLVETDTSVPDVYKAYKDTIGGELVNLDEREGWIDLVNLIESKAESAIVINTGARNQTGISNFGKTLGMALPELKRKLVVFWLIDRKRESLELLKDFAGAIPEAEMHVVRNTYLGTEGKFELYNGSKMKVSVEDAGGRSLNFPELADRVTDAMNKGRLTITKASTELSLGDRMELERWRRSSMANIEESFALLLGRQATEKERQNLYRVRDALNLKGNDALWLLLMVLEYYRSFYERIPALITEAARAATRDVQAMAAAQISAAVETAKAAVSRAMAEASAAVAKRESQRMNPLKWATGCVLATTACLTLAAWFAYCHGQVAGFANGSEVAQRRYANAAALASWANTPEGELGYALAKAGSLRELATCSGRGWVTRDEVCYATSKAQGWHLPVSPEHSRN